MPLILLGQHEKYSLISTLFFVKLFVSVSSKFLKRSSGTAFTRKTRIMHAQQYGTVILTDQGASGGFGCLLKLLDTFIKKDMFIF